LGEITEWDVQDKSQEYKSPYVVDNSAVEPELEPGARPARKISRSKEKAPKYGTSFLFDNSVVEPESGEIR
jgi:hypothetical protein